MAETVVQGKNVLLAVSRNDTDYYPFACAQEVTLSEDTELLPTTTVNSSDFRTFTTRLSDWKLQHSGVLLLNKGSHYNFLDLFNATDRRQGLYVKVTYTDDTGASRVIKGKILLPSKSVTSTVGQLAKWAAEMQGTGPYVLADIPIPDGIADTSGPFVVAAYVTDDVRNRIVLELNEPLGGYRIPDAEWYPNLSHTSVFSNVDGTKIYIFTNTDYEEGQDIRLTYSGGSVIDLAGNQMSTFENLPVQNRIGAGVTNFTAYWGWVEEDPLNDIFVMGNDGNVPFTSGQFPYGTPIYADLHTMPSEGYYAVIKEPDDEPAKNQWRDTGAQWNSGPIPDSVWSRFEKNGFRYYITRTSMTFDRGTNSRVVFSI